MWSVQVDLAKAVAKWRKGGATRLVIQPGGREVAVTPETRPDAVADLAGDAETVEAYQENSLVGVWRRPPESAATVDPMASVAVMVKAQAAFLGEMMSLQVASLRTVREAMETAAALRPNVPALLRDDDDEGQSERDGALLAALMRPAAVAPTAAPPANGEPKK